MANLQDYQTALDALVPGTLPLGEPEKLIAIAKALKAHSRNRPRRLVDDLPGSGGFDYPVSSLSNWDDEFSAIQQVEYPVDDTHTDPDILEYGDWTLYEKPAGKALRFLNDRPLATETMRITYTALHVFDADDVCSVAAADDEAVQTLAASFFCEMIAAAFAQNQESAIQADAVDQVSKRREYSAQAKKYRSEYDDHIGAKGGPKAACATSEWDVDYPGGCDRLTHPRRYR